MKLAYLLVPILFFGCAGPTPPEGRAERRPEITQQVRELEKPIARINNVNTALEKKVAVLERERELLKAEASEWEQEMARWEDRGLTAEQKLDLTLTELKKVRANWFTQLDEHTSGLKEDLRELMLSYSEVNTKYHNLLEESAKHDQQTAEDQAQINTQTKKIKDLAADVSVKEKKIASLTTILWITGSLAGLFVLYIVLRVLKLTPYGSFLFWLP